MKDFLIITARGVVKYSLIIGAGFDEQGRFMVVFEQDGEPSPLSPWDIAKLRQDVRDGKLDPRRFGRLRTNSAATAEPRTDDPESDLPASLFLVRNENGDIELRQPDDFVSLISGGQEHGQSSAPDRRVYRSAFICNFELGVGYACKDFGKGN